MMKMELRGRPPSIGAWCLAWHIGTAHRGDMVAFAKATQLGVFTVAGLLDGSVIPADLMAATITAATRGSIVKIDFQRNADGIRWHRAPRAYAPRGERMAA
jgi:hypothetical protein